MTAREIYSLYTTYSKMSSYDMDLDTGCMILDNIENLSKPYGLIEKRREEIIKKYAEKDADGNIKPNENNAIHILDINTCQKELDNLFDEETEIDIKPIYKSALENVKISPADLLYLKKYLK